MLWFRYRWILTFSHGLCVKIIRGGDAVKQISSEINALFAQRMNLNVGKAILSRILRLVGILESIIFSASALLYREEKDLIKFSKRVEETAERLIARLRREKGNYERDARKLEGMIRESQQKKQELPKRLQVRIEGEKREVTEDETRKKEVLSLLHQMTNFIEEMDGIIHDIHLKAKAQKRGTLNVYTLEENIIIRSNFRLGKKTKGKGIEAGELVKIIRKKLDYFGNIVRRGKKLDKNDVANLLRYCRMEATDLQHVFLFVIQLRIRVEHMLNRLSAIISRDPRLRVVLIKDFDGAVRRLSRLKSDIETQQKRLDNEFKKRGFIPNAQILSEIRTAA